MTDAPTTREERFFALVYPALQEAGYTAYRGQQRLVADTGMSTSTASRLINREQIPHVQFFAPLAKATGLSPIDLLVAAEVLPPDYLESQQTLSETKQSQVGSDPITPEEAAERLGIHDEVGKFTFLAVVEKLKNPPAEDAEDENPGGTAAQM
ncbi:helix-turn-helix domain-containing protein [Streptomyces canus]|uniref:helix-turn-helix domain-containing protein n=1 Tax=Streptomyces canus TaxID=58343 RepID=UPI003686E93F